MVAVNELLRSTAQFGKSVNRKTASVFFSVRVAKEKKSYFQCAASSDAGNVLLTSMFLEI